MTEVWLNENILCSFDELVRIELSPQIIELECTSTNLRDEVTAPHYHAGKIDAFGKRIVPDVGEKMNCVDWRAKHVPFIWKIYQLQEITDLDEDKKPIKRFIMVDQKLDRDEAIEVARAIREDM